MRNGFLSLVLESGHTLAAPSGKGYCLSSQGAATPLGKGSLERPHFEERVPVSHLRERPHLQERVPLSHLSERSHLQERLSLSHLREWPHLHERVALSLTSESGLT